PLSVLSSCSFVHTLHSFPTRRSSDLGRLCQTPSRWRFTETPYKCTNTMKFSHTEEKREDRQLDVLTDEENGLRIIVSRLGAELIDRKSTRLNSSHEWISYAVFCLKKK